MSQPSLCRITGIAVVDFVGGDSEAILHTLTTNDVKSLSEGQSCETFVTNVKGKTVAHGVMLRLADRFRFVGAAGHSEALAEHVDRYIIREDCLPTIRDEEFEAIAGPDLGLAESWATEFVSSQGQPIEKIPAGWLGAKGFVAVAECAEIECVVARLSEKGIVVGAESEFHDARINALFPW